MEQNNRCSIDSAKFYLQSSIITRIQKIPSLNEALSFALLLNYSYIAGILSLKISFKLYSYKLC